MPWDYIYIYPLDFGSTGHVVGCCGSCPKHDHDLQHALQHGMLHYYIQIIGWVGILISQLCGQILYMICNMHCDVDSYMPGGVGMLPTDIEASRWSNIYIYTYVA